MCCLVFVGVLVFYSGYCVLLFCMGGFVVFVGCVLVVSLARIGFGDVVCGFLGVSLLVYGVWCYSVFSWYVLLCWCFGDVLLALV